MDRSYIYLLLIPFLLVACVGQKAVFVNPNTGQDFRLRHITYEGDFFSTRMQSRFRKVLKESPLFTKDLASPGLDLKVRKINSETNTTGMVFTGTSTIHYLFIDPATGKVILDATNTISTRSTAADMGQRSQELGMNLAVDNADILITELRKHGLPESKKPLKLQGNKSGLVGMIAMSPLYAVGAVGLAGIETAKASGKIANEAGKALAQIDQSDIDKLSSEMSNELAAVDRGTRNAMYSDALTNVGREFGENSTTYVKYNPNGTQTSLQTNDDSNGDLKKDGREGDAGSVKKMCYQVESNRIGLKKEWDNDKKRYTEFRETIWEIGDERKDTLGMREIIDSVVVVYDLAGREQPSYIEYPVVKYPALVDRNKSVHDQYATCGNDAAQAISLWKEWASKRGARRD
ncbi:MAG: hypothetical protein KKD73_07800 [Proteobacteria bacterium]|nr:hypothetical protein [Pseudomonadota bacterium]